MKPDHVMLCLGYLHKIAYFHHVYLKHKESVIACICFVSNDTNNKWSHLSSSKNAISWTRLENSRGAVGENG